MIEQLEFDYDVAVIGSGFGGSVSALRLTEKRYKVAVFEAGRRFDATNYPKTSWDAKNFIWAPKFGCFGMQRIQVLPHVVALGAAGVGGGSLLYANTLYEPLEPFYQDKQWRHIADWRTELAPHYDQAKRMLGVVENPVHTDADRIMKEIAEEMGVGDTFHPTPVGVFFGGPGTQEGTDVEDPFFGGAGPSRTTCIKCGSCMSGCKYNAKNTLDRNYLYLAEKAGAEVHPMTTVTVVRPRPGGGYLIETVATGKSGRRSKHRRTFTTEQVVFSAGTYNTQKLLHEMRDTGVLAQISSRLGVLTRTNSEAILIATARKSPVDHSQGIALTSSFHPDANTHIEPNHFGAGNGAMSLLQTAMTDGDTRYPRFLEWLRQIAKHPMYLRFGWIRHWEQRSVVLTVMQAVDNSITISGRKTVFGRYTLTSNEGHGEPSPNWIPVGNKVTRRVAEKINGSPGGTVGEIVNKPMTAHFLGGCAIGDSPETGVIDAWHRIYGYDGLHVVDGAAVSANLGVNPSLTITAQAERAMSFWPNRGEADPRLPLGSTYQRVPAVAPKRPAVPPMAHGALRLTITPVTGHDALPVGE